MRVLPRIYSRKGGDANSVLFRDADICSERMTEWLGMRNSKFKIMVNSGEKGVS